MTKILDAIPTMKMRDLVNLWRNAIKTLATAGKASQHPLASAVLAAIRKEWERRARTPLAGDEIFAWPGTEADRGSGDLDTSDWVKEGVLQFVGYKVGGDGEVRGVRERILSEIFRGPIPPVFPLRYLAEWGKPESVMRLQKMAETIAALTRNGKRRKDARMHAAILDWESDLNFLYDEYYVGHFHFAWPTAKI